jgi:hypothetical protein
VEALVHLGREQLRFGHLEPGSVLEMRVLEASLAAAAQT